MGCKSKNFLVQAKNEYKMNTDYSRDVRLAFNWNNW